MNKYIAKIIDLYAIHEKNRHHSLNSQYLKSNDNPVSLDSFSQFYSMPKRPNIKFNPDNTYHNYEIGNFQYESEIKNNFESNNDVKGSYYINNHSKTNIILVHGWRTDKWTHVKDLFLDSFIKENFNIFFIELPHHFTRCSKTASYSGEHFITANIDRTILSVKQAVSDIRALIKFLQEKDEKIVLIGVSLGGLLVNLVSALEEQLDGIVSVFYADSLANFIWNQRPGKFIKRDFELNNCEFQIVKAYWNIIQASNFKPKIPKEKILLITALYDLFIVAEDSELLWKAWNEPQRIIYKCGHSGMVTNKKEIAVDCLGFVKNVVK
jgi:dienelactone hydrolase